MKLSIPLAFFGMTLAASAAESVPVFDVGPGCHAATSLMRLDPERSKRCMDDEASARAEVAKQWSSYPAADRRRCSTEAQLDGLPSYVDLLECLTMAREATLAPD